MMSKIMGYMGFLCFFFLFGCTCISIPSFVQPVRPLEEQVIQGKGPGKILLVDISGTISEKRKSKGIGLTEEMSMVERIKEELNKAESDQAIAGLILRINSPGGTVTASDIIYHEICEFKKRTGVKVIASFLDIAASGGYYVACAADRIIAHPTTITGSIGIIAFKFNIQGLLSKIGVEEESIKAGDKKDLMTPFRAATAEEREIMQTIINNLHQRFIDVVEQGRPSLNREEIERIADGRVFSAEQALDMKLIDQIGYLDDTIHEMKQELGLKEATVIAYLRPGDYKGTIYSANTTTSHSSFDLLAIDRKGLVLSQDVRFMYLWMHALAP